MTPLELVLVLAVGLWLGFLGGRRRAETGRARHDARQAKQGRRRWRGK